MSVEYFVGLDVGEKRIGVAIGDSEVCIAVPSETIEVDGTEIDEIRGIVERCKADKIVVGYPRNQSGQATKQTEFVENFTKKLADLRVKIVFQDESLTSVVAEDRLKMHARPYKKGDIDSRAAAIILQDYIEAHYENKK